jgi:hypothetical protein
MSLALQRVLVRMLHDPDFAQAVFAGGTLPELTPKERDLLLTSDPRAYRTDPYRRSRVLQGLIEEYPASVALASRGGQAMGRVDRFLSSPAFHQTIQNRGSIALAFGTWLALRAPEVATLERAVACARRRTRPRGAGLALATGTEPVRLAGGTVARWQFLKAALGVDPVAALVTKRVEINELPPLGDEPEFWVVVHRVDTSTALIGGSEGTHEILDAARSPLSRATLIARTQAMGADPTTAETMIDDLVADELLSKGADNPKKPS